MHSVSRKRKALETAQPGTHEASRGHRLLLQLWGTSKRGSRLVPLPSSASAAHACISPCIKSSDRVTTGSQISLLSHTKPNRYVQTYIFRCVYICIF